MLDVGHLDHDDHRRIARRMDLFHFEDNAPGMVFWHDLGRRIFRELRDAAFRHANRREYRIVASPQLVRRPIWEASGHWEHFDDSMFIFDGRGRRSAALKPVSCPCHLKIAAGRLQSYRDLPMRIAEFGLVHRDEPSGSLHGLFRLRAFYQDDGHILCRADQSVEEVARFCADLSELYAAFDLEPAKVVLALRPEERLEDEARWERAEQILREGARRGEISVEEVPGDGAFYGPKLEWHVEDHAGRLWQAGSIQSDLFMPERFGLSYADEKDEPRCPVLLHRALYGSPERFMGLLLEAHGGDLPVWVAPDQAVALPIGEDHCRYARRLAGELRVEGVRAGFEPPDRSLGSRIAEARKRGIPYLLIVGDRELEHRSVAVRRGDEQCSMRRRRALRHVLHAAQPPV